MIQMILTPELIKLAYANRASFDRLPQEEKMRMMRSIPDWADILWGVFPTLEEQDEFDVLIIKGEPYLSTIAREDGAGRVRVSTLACTCIEEALAMRKVFGDGAALH